MFARRKLKMGTLNRDLAISLSVLKGWERSTYDGGTVSLAILAGYVKNLIGEGFDVADIVITKTNDGYYSQEIDSFLTESYLHGQLDVYESRCVVYNDAMRVACLKSIKAEIEELPELSFVIEAACSALRLKYRTFFC